MLTAVKLFHHLHDALLPASSVAEFFARGESRFILIAALAWSGPTACTREPCGHAAAARDTQRLATVANALRAWHAAFGRWPTEAEGLGSVVSCPSSSGLDCRRFPAAGFATTDALRDVCARPMRYTIIDGRPRLSTLGVDGEAGTADDTDVDVVPLRQETSP